MDFSDILSVEGNRTCLIENLKRHIKNRSVPGIDIDIANIAMENRDAYVSWLLSLVESFHEDGLSVIVSVPFNNPAFDYGNIGKMADMVIVKAYDEHELG